MMIRLGNPKSYCENLRTYFEEHLDQYLEEVADGSRRVLRESKGRNMKARPK